jgi:hypothetical protein
MGGRSAAKRLARQRLNSRAYEEREELQYLEARARAQRSRAIAKSSYRRKNYAFSLGSVSSGALSNPVSSPATSGTLRKLVPLALAHLSTGKESVKAADFSAITGTAGPSGSGPACAEGSGLPSAPPAESVARMKAMAAATVSNQHAALDASPMPAPHSHGGLLLCRAA